MFQRHQKSCVIIISVLLLAWQFYFVKQSKTTEKILESETFSSDAQKHLNLIGNEVEDENSNEKTLLPIPNAFALKTTHEPYKVMEKYEQEKLPEVDPPFKRILFWNDVMEYFNCFDCSPASVQT